MLELRNFQQDYARICGSSISDENKVEVAHKLIAKYYSHISEECYAWLYSLDDDDKKSGEDV